MEGGGGCVGDGIFVGAADNPQPEAGLIEIGAAEIPVKEAAFREEKKHLPAPATAEEELVPVHQGAVGMARETKPAERAGSLGAGGGSGPGHWKRHQCPAATTRPSSYFTGWTGCWRAITQTTTSTQTKNAIVP
jgi:hypothetical protein